MVTSDQTEINPADYFSPDAPVPELGIVRKLWYPAILTGVGVTCVCFMNAYKRKPFFSGLQQHVMGGSLGLILGVGAERWVQRQAAERDNLYYHYILSHPEDFPPVVRKKYSEVLQSWLPVR